MITQVLECFVTVLGRCAAILFSLPITADVSVGSFFVASAILGTVICVVFAGIRNFVSLYNAAQKERSRAAQKELRAAQKNRSREG